MRGLSHRGRRGLEQIAPNPPELTSGGLNLSRIGAGPRDGGRVAREVRIVRAWNTSPRAFNAAATRHGEFSVLFDPASANRDQTFGTEWTLDVSAGYKTGGWTFTVGGDNVTTNIRTSSSCRNTTGAQIPYSAASPFGFNGAFMYGKVFKW